ncbi:hypothetical protein [Culicoidibacter larvae]|uniref:DUF4352 domain-containing protein n=1 Tax=Culicoidibacter larvae TaxID=2579976 RepID=A0A5R8QAQ9_9FIRM|nr:hypothetical protein [Culicoidibacter larvae]TLG72983.1 hypothetical protein FEZ08_08025 [Culicoidibacter larvae]
MDANDQQFDVEAMLNGNKYTNYNQPRKPFAKQVWVLIVFPLLAVVIGLTIGGMSGWAIGSYEQSGDFVYEGTYDYEQPSTNFDVDTAKAELASLHQDLWATDIPAIELNKVFHVYDAVNGYTDFEITIKAIEVVENPSSYSDDQVIRIEMDVKNLEKDELFFWTYSHLQVLDMDGFALEDIYVSDDQTSADIASGKTKTLVAYYEYEKKNDAIMLELWDYDMAYGASKFVLTKGGE